MSKLPVIFRMEGIGERATCVAFFPTMPEDWHGLQMSCYAHVGQHFGASFGYYSGTRKAKPAEYADLLAELRSIYETGEDAVTLQVYQKMTPQHRAAFNASVAQYQAPKFLIDLMTVVD